MKENFDGLIDHLLKAGFFLEQAVEILEQGMIEQVLLRTGGNQSEASRILGIHRNTLLRKMVAFQIDGSRPRSKPAASATARDSKKSRRAS